MANLDKDLIKAINSGRCILLVGAGVSAEAGFPTWNELLDLVVQDTKTKGLINDNDIQKIKKANILDGFEILSKKITKARLVNQIKDIFASILTKNGNTYNKIIEWPIDIYLTTNFDSLLINKLKEKGLQYTIRSNSKEDFRLLRNSTRKTVFKIHGDFNDPETMIITKSDYDAIRTGKGYEYWREKVSALLHMSDFIIIGYSARDPNFVDQLNRAKDIADPDHPVFMFAADISNEEIIKYYQENNIRIISYDNHDGKHSGLKTLLNQYGIFIRERGHHLLGKEDVDPSEAELASSVYFYNEVVLNNINIISKALYNILLNILNSNSHNLSFEDIKRKMYDQKMTVDEISLNESLEELIENKYISCNYERLFSITSKGKDLLLDARSCNREKKDQFILYCRDFLIKRNYTPHDIDIVLDKIESGLISGFKKRGMEIAKMVFLDSGVSLKTSTDIVIEIEKFSTGLNESEFNGFTELFLDILQSPSMEVREYLALLCNGYFIFNILGHDKNSRLFRLKELTNKEMIIDSSILIPLVAKDSINHVHTMNLLREILKTGINIIVTERLIKEVIDHAYWAISNFKNATIIDTDFIAAAMGVTIKQNLFIDGSMKWMHGRSEVKFIDYMHYCFGDDANNLDEAIRNIITSFNIRITSMDDLNRFDTTIHYGEFEEMRSRIKVDRIAHSTFRSESQCETEAELVIFSKLESVNFLTHSTNLKYITQKENLLHWSPEILFRFLKLNTTSNVELDDLYTCMVNDFYNCGFNIVNKELLQAFMSPSFSQARMEIENQKRLFGEGIDKLFSDENINKHTNDLTLPFYTIQAAFQMAKKSEMEKRDAIKLIDEMRQLRTLNEKERKEYENFKSRQKEKRRRNQSKKKNKKRRKRK
jgi:hypothetical protein